MPLKLFLDMLSSSSEDVTRALRGLPKRLSRNYLRRNGGKCHFIYIFIFYQKTFDSKDVFGTLSRPFVRLSFCLLLTRLAVHFLPFIRF